MDIVTPVLAVVQVVLEAAKKCAEVRKEVLDAFDELEDVFSDVELFLGTFQEEGPILKQAVSLVATVLLATERGILFFTRPNLTRGVTAIMRGMTYEKPLLDSLKDIKSRSKKLMEQAVKTHISNFSSYSGVSLGILRLIQQSQGDSQIALDDMNAKIDSISKEHNEIKEQLRIWDKEQHKRDAQEIEALRAIIHSTTPSQTNSMWEPTRLPQLTPPAEMAYIGQDELWSLLNISDIDTADMEEIKKKSDELPLRDRSRTEQIVKNHSFQKWIVSPASAKLMVYSNFSDRRMETSALSLFNTTLAEEFRSWERCLCLVWFCGRHLDYGSDSDSDWSDSDGDRDWVYEEEDIYNPETRQDKAKRMMRSLIAQLLCDYDFGPMHLLPPDVNPNALEKGHSLSQLRRVFRWLVRQLPEDITLFCLIDGAVYYERDEFVCPMLDALGDLLELTVSNDVRPVVKVLVTSPLPLPTFRVGFRDNETLPMDLLAPAHVDFSKERLIRNLRGIGDEKAEECEEVEI